MEKNSEEMEPPPHFSEQIPLPGEQAPEARTEALLL